MERQLPCGVFPTMDHRKPATEKSQLPLIVFRNIIQRFW